MMPGVLLAIETSQRTGSVAIALADGRVDHEPLHSTARHEDDLMPAIDRLCRRCAITPGDIRGVGVSIGPGGFTGLRIALSTAKMLAESLGAVIAAVPSALVTAEAIASADPLLVCLASKRDTTWATRLQRDTAAGHWRVVGTPGIVTAESVALDNIALVLADEFLPGAVRDRVAAAGCAIAAPTFDARHSLAVAARMIDSGATTDQLALAPIYAREPEAVRLWEKARRHKGT